MDLLPHCRARRVPAGGNRGMLGPWLSVFCANCGADGGMVPEENKTFVFSLCNTCAESYGELAHVLWMPMRCVFNGEQTHNWSGMAGF
jgi:hypothetical protein